MNSLVEISIAFLLMFALLSVAIGGWFLYLKNAKGLFGIVLAVFFALTAANLHKDYDSFSCDTNYLNNLRTDVITKYPDLIKDYHEMVSGELDVTVGDVRKLQKKIKKLENDRLLKMAN